MGKITIIRGLPGSGKSTLAHELAMEQGGVLVEPDAYMYVGGKYCYCPGNYRRAVALAGTAVEVCCLAGCDCIYADVLPTLAEVLAVARRYTSAAVDWREWQVDVISLPWLDADEVHERNIHNVCDADVKRMVDHFEIFSALKYRTNANGVKVDWNFMDWEDR